MFNDFSPGKLLMLAGIVLLLVGAALHFGGKIFPFGNLPGDIKIEKGNFSFHFPIVTCIVISVLLSIILNFFTRR